MQIKPAITRDAPDSSFDSALLSVFPNRSARVTTTNPKMTVATERYYTNENCLFKKIIERSTTKGIYSIFKI